MKKLQILTTIIFLSALAACSAYNQADFVQEYMVEAYVIADRALPNVRLSLTQEAFERFDFEQAAVSDALVQIALLDATGSVEREFEYTLSAPGIYRVVDQSYKAESGRTYQLVVETSDATLRSETTLPTSIRSSPPEEIPLVYQGEEQFAVEVAATSTTDRQTSFIFSVLASDVIEDNLTPFYASVFDDAAEEDDNFESNPDSVKNVNLSELAIVNSGIVNEANYEIQPNGNILIRLPWIAVAFYGSNTVVANSIDDNLLDFVRSQSVQLGGSTLAPGEIQNIINRIDGGIGIFGSMSTDTARVQILRNPLIDQQD